MKRSHVLTSATVLSLTLIAACSPKADSAILEWRLPLDEYRTAQRAVNEWAENVLLGECMEERGSVLKIAAPAERGEVWNEFDRRLFSVKIAESYGYHTDPLSQDAIDADTWNSATSTSDAAWSAHFEQCIADARTELPLPENLILADLLGVDAYRQSLEDPRVVERASEWRKCFNERSGLRVEVDPDEMPTVEMAEDFDLYVDTSADLEVEPMEQEIAIMDAECRESTGYTATLYDTEVENQEDLLSTNFQELEDAGQAVRLYEQQATEILRTRGLL